jgi:hypothetical protein
MFLTEPTRDQKGQALVELALILPLLLLLAFGTIEFSNMIDINLALTHVTREGANLTSRDRTLTEAELQGYLDTVINAAKPVLCPDSAGCTTNVSKYFVIYSRVVYNPALGACGANLDNGLPDNYRIRRLGTWTKGSFSQQSKIGNDGDCADAGELGTSIKSMADGQIFHVVEAFYNYSGGAITPVQSVLGFALPNMFYDRTIFTQI